MKYRITLSVLYICILLMATGCNSHAEEQAEVDISTSGYDNEITDEVISDEKTVSADVTESGQEEQTQLPVCYQELINDAKECLGGNVEKEPADYDFCYIISAYGPHFDDEDKERLGYLIEDIDGNGTEELIFGENGTGAWEGVVYDLYTIYDGELVHVFSGGERDRYYLCGEGMIANEGSSSAATSSNTYYLFEGTELYLVEAILYNGGDSPENPWFYSTLTDDYYDLENAEPINEEQAQAIMEKYVYERTAFIPFMEE